MKKEFNIGLKNGINIPDLSENELVKKEKINTEQKFTKPPVRFDEGSIVKEMKEQGIGRPATYAATIATLFSRDYIKTEKKSLVPTELGVQVTKYSEKNFIFSLQLPFSHDIITLKKAVHISAEKGVKRHA